MSVKFNKKKIIIAIAILILLFSISVLSIFAFQFKKPGDLSVSNLGRPSLEAVQSLAGIINFQVEIGQLRASEFRVLAFSSSRNAVVALISDGSLSVTVSGSDVSFSGTHFLYFYDSDYGFFYNSSASSTSFSSSNIFFSSVPISSSSVNINGFNSSATFGSAGYNAYSIYQYYDYIYSSCVDREERESTIRQEAQSEGYSEGFNFGVENGYRQGFDEGEEEGYSEGYSEGESVGYSSGHRDGFDEGLDEGYTLGYDVGFESGYSEGYTLGFDDGFESGYDEGYSEGYETGYNIVYDDLQQPGTIQAIFTRKDSSGNILYLAHELDLENSRINYAFVPKDQLSDSIDGYGLYVKTYDVTKYLESHPLDFDYPLPVIDFQNTDFLALYRKVNVTREYFDLYRVYSYVEVKIDQSFIDQLYNQYNEGLNDANAIVNGIGDIASKPIVSLKDALDFEIFGLNIGVVAVGIVAILFAIWAYYKIRKVLPI